MDDRRGGHQGPSVPSGAPRTGQLDGGMDDDEKQSVRKGFDQAVTMSPAEL